MGVETSYKGFDICNRCDLSLFQMDVILNSYLSNDDVPNWIVNGVIELGSWVYNRNVRGSGYFNAADEIISIFAIDRDEMILLNELNEIKISNLPDKRILEILRNSFIILYDNEYIYPGELTTKLINLRWQGLELNCSDFKKCLSEMRGVISVAITKNLLTKGSFVPQKAFAVFKLLSQIVLCNENKECIDPHVQDYDLDIAFVKLPDRLKYRLVREICGFRDGESKIVDDVDFNKNISLKPEVINYAEHIRERYRDRNIERNR
jgi:hypothetical protein